MCAGPPPAAAFKFTKPLNKSLLLLIERRKGSK